MLMIKTLRLKIAPWQQSHAEDFLKLTQDQGFNLFPITIYRQEDLESAREWILNVKTKWGVWELVSGELIGMGGLTPWKWDGEDLIDITYRLKQGAWGKGYGMELAEALVDYGRHELGLSHISATITPDNTASIKIAEKLGMKFSQKIILLGVETFLYRLEN
jgi:RimJ/RimL family protein N-acetyltransferase